MTTATRIQEIIEAGLLDFNARPACEKIADEIDDLRERNAFLLTSAETAQAKLTEARAEIEQSRARHEACAAQLDKCESALRLALAGTEQNYFDHHARIDDVRLALAKSEAEVQRLDRITRLQQLALKNPGIPPA